MRLRALAVVALLAAASGCDSGTAPPAHTDPESARIVTEDIVRFWTAFEQIQNAGDSMPLRRWYLDPGTIGLRDFTAARWKNAKTLTAMVWPLRTYYASIKQNTLGVAGIEPVVRDVYRSLDTLYADAVFPDVYLAIGGMATGGTVSQHGLLIGTELFARAEDSPLDPLTAWQKSVVRSIDVLPAIVAHELVHMQQRSAGSGTLLHQAIREGSADFVGQLLSGITINDHLRAYADAHEAELWTEFSQAMNGNDVSNWLYNGGTVTPTSPRPADLGYYVGYRITEAYWAREPDKRKALREILSIQDARAFLQASGYDP